MYTISEIYQSLCQTPGLVDSIGIEKAMKFIRLTTKLKDEITISQPPQYDPSSAPEELPRHVRQFLSLSVDMPDAFVDACWTAFCETIWNNDEELGADKDNDSFRKHGLDHKLC
jgi:hypothetical protein